MVQLPLILAFVVCVLGTTTQPKVEVDDRIYGGRKTSITSRPYQVSVQFEDDHICGGSLYKKDVVITAAHCLMFINSGDLKVRLGSTKHASGGILVNVSSAKEHPKFSFNLQHDVAVLHLQKPVTLSSSIQTIDLAASQPSSGSDAVVSGWGITEGSFKYSPELLETNLKVLTKSECSSKAYKYGSKVSGPMFCALNSGKDSCKGDSGGPLVSGGKLIGIVSWGDGCAKKGYPGVYTDVFAERSWIIANS